MSEKFARISLISIIMLLFFSILAMPALTGFPPRFFDRPGKGTATFYVTPQDSIFEVPPTTNGTWFTVYVRIANATFCAGWQVELFYNKQYLYTSPDKVTYASDMPFLVTPVNPTVDSYNATYNYVLHCGISQPFTEYNITDAGLVKIDFQIIAIPPPTATYASLLYFGVGTESAFGSWTLDYNNDENDLLVYDGYYEIRGLTPPKANLEISPTLKRIPATPGDRIVNTSRAIFSVDILINNVNPADELFIVQFELSYNKTLVQGVWIDEGTFMNNPAWAPHGTLDNSTIVEEGRMLYWVMIAPNDTGYWDNTEWPSGGGLLATARLEIIWQGPDSDGVAPEELLASSPLTLKGVFGEFFIGHPNLPDPEYLPYDPPINGRVDIYGYYWQAPTAAFTWTPETPLVGPITFDASSSVGYRNNLGVLMPENDYIISYYWDFGDGTNATMTGAGNYTVTHNYTLPGDYSLSLTVTDKDGRTDTEALTLTVVEELTHEIIWETYTFHVKTVSDTSITSLNFTQTHRFIKFAATSHFGTTFFCNITIPKQLLYSQPSLWYILKDGTQILPTEYAIAENTTHTTIYIPYGSGTHTIHIFGTDVIPEFSSVTMPIIFTLMTLFAFGLTVIRRWRREVTKKTKS